jgi:hypothetical protein
MSHQDTYAHNKAYAEFLANWDANFYTKYADTLRPARPGARANGGTGAASPRNAASSSRTRRSKCASTA